MWPITSGRLRRSPGFWISSVLAVAVAFAAFFGLDFVFQVFEFFGFFVGFEFGFFSFEFPLESFAFEFVAFPFEPGRFFFPLGEASVVTAVPFFFGEVFRVAAAV